MYWTGLNREDADHLLAEHKGNLRALFLATASPNSADIHLRSRRFAETDPATSQYNPLLIRLIQAEIKHLRVVRKCSDTP